MSYVWHEGGYRWIYQFFVSFGLLACAFYFFILSKGDVTKRIFWGLSFLILSPISYSNAVFWESMQSELKTSHSNSQRWGGDVDLFGFLMEARIGPDIPVSIIAIMGILVANGVFISKDVTRERVIGGNILLLVWIIMMYLMAS
jgi:hypothetical protein